EGQATREELAASTAASRVMAAPTVPVSSIAGPTQAIPADRPAWARLPGRPEPARPAGGRRRAAPPHGPVGGRHRTTSTPRGRRGVAAAIVALGLLIAVGGWWFGVGRYTEAPSLMGLTKGQAVALAAKDGFTLAYDQGRYDEKIAKDTVVG